MIQREKVKAEHKLAKEKLDALKAKEALFQRQKELERQSAQDADDIISLANSQLQVINIVAKAVCILTRARVH